MFQALNARIKGFRTYIALFVLCLPDMLDAVGALDLSALYPPGYAPKVAGAIALARVVLGTYIRRLPPAPPPADGGQH